MLEPRLFLFDNHRIISCAIQIEWQLNRFAGEGAEIEWEAHN